MSLSLVTKPNLNILINKNSGKWIAFKNNEEIKSEIIEITNKQQLMRKYGEKFANLLWNKRVEMAKKSKNKLCYNMNCLVINVTNNCNLKCEYCYVNKYDNRHFIESDTIIKSVKMFASNIYPNKLTVIFHGGEPLLAFDKIKEAVIKLINVNNVVYSLQTNGTLLDSDKLDFFKKHKFLIGLSIDGINDENNSLRNVDGKMRDYTLNNLKILSQNKDFVKPLLVIHRKNINSIKEIVDYFKNNGFDGLVCNLLFESNDFKNCVLDDSLFENMKYTLDVMMENFDGENFSFSERDIRLLFRKVVFGFLDEYMCMNSPCGAGKETIAIDYNGNVWGCNVLISKNKDQNYMGNVFNNSVEEILNKKISISKRNIKNIVKCMSCPYKVLCGGGGCCGFISHQNNKLLDNSIYCNYHFKLITYIIESVMKYNKTDILVNF